MPRTAEKVSLADRLTWNIGDVGSPVNELKLAWTRYISLKPTPKQLAFLLLPCFEALFGGAGGPGKSSALLMGALQYVDTAGYAALLIRKTFSDLSLPSALIDVTRSWLASTDAKWSEVEKTWHFPSNATLTFGYLDSAKDKYRYQSAEFQYIGIDELTQFPEMDYTFMFSRLRRLADTDVPVRMRCASNPGNVGHDWVKKRFITEATTDRIFVPAKLTDNPHLDIEMYRRSLAELDPITRRQIEDGDWTARHGGSKFKREWFGILKTAPVELSNSVRFWDMAATEAKPGKDPDYSVGLKLAQTSDGVFYILDLRRMRGTSHDVERLVKQTADMDGISTKIRMEQEPGSSGKAIIDHYVKVLVGYDFRGMLSTGSKEVRANPVASQAEAGNMKIIGGPWLAAFLDEAELFPTGSHDDQVDALSGALSALSEKYKEFMIG